MVVYHGCGQVTKISVGVLDHRKFWDGMHTVSLDQLARIEHRLPWAWFDAGLNSAAKLAHLVAAGLGFVGSVPPSDCADLLARPATDRQVVGPDRFPGVTALEDRRRVFGADRRVVLTHSASLHAAQTRGFDQTMATAIAKLSVPGDTLARGHTRRARDKVTAEITHIVKDPWVRRVVSWQLTGDTPASTGSASTSTTQPTLTWRPRSSATRADDRPRPVVDADVVAGYSRRHPLIPAAQIAGHHVGGIR